MRIAVVSCSLNPDSRSARMAARLRAPLEAAGALADWIDLREHPLPLCDGATSYGAPAVGAMAQRLASAQAIVLAAPVYNFDVNAAAKNLIELTGKGAWQDKVVSLVCSAGGRGSYMSAMALANSLMLDFRCVIVPRFVYADDGDFVGAEISGVIEKRLEDLARETIRFTQALDKKP